MIKFEVGQVYYSVFTGESDLTRDYEDHEVICPKQHEYMKPQYVSKNFFEGVYLDPRVEF